MTKATKVKPISRLTGALLAKKGQAASAALSLDQQRSNHSSLSGNKPDHDKADIAKSFGKPVTGKRIAMTLRMGKEDHLRLRLFSAYTRRSCQSIISEALDCYLIENREKIPPLKIASQNI